jgi:integrase
MTKKLTAIAIENLKPGTARQEIADGKCTGLFHIIQASGVRSWAVRYRRPGDKKNAKLTLGRCPPITLAQARQLASAALLEVSQGRDPGIAKRQAKADAIDRSRDTVRARYEQYLEQHCKKHTRENTWKAIAGMFARDVLPAWGERSVHDVRRRDVIDLVEEIARVRPVMANRVLMAVSKFFNWMMARDVIVASPVAGVALPTKEKDRERVLSDPEIVRFWKACDAIPKPFGDIYKLLLLLGSRRQEVSEIAYSEIDEQARTWVLPAERSKNGKPRLTPLSRQAWDIISRQPRIAGSSFVFARRAAHSHMKAPLDAAMQPDAPFVIHDVRRTCASGLQKIGTDVAVTEKILGHEGGTFRGIVGVYQQHSYIEEKRAALQMWANRIDALVKGEAAGKVVKFGKRRAGVAPCAPPRIGAASTN